MEEVLTLDEFPSGKCSQSRLKQDTLEQLTAYAVCGQAEGNGSEQTFNQVHVFVLMNQSLFLSCVIVCSTKKAEETLCSSKMLRTLLCTFTKQFLVKSIWSCLKCHSANTDLPTLCVYLVFVIIIGSQRCIYKCVFLMQLTVWQGPIFMMAFGLQHFLSCIFIFELLYIKIDVNENLVHS